MHDKMLGSFTYCLEVRGSCPGCRACGDDPNMWPDVARTARTCGPFSPHVWSARPGDGPDMWLGRPGHVARTARTCGPDMWTGRPGHVARTARTCGPDSMEERGSCPCCPGWVLCGRCSNPFVRFKGVGGFGWLMSEKMFGASMAVYGSGGVDG